MMINNKLTLLSLLLFACTPDAKDVDDDQDGFTENEGDCDDTNKDINKDANEICDGVDNNCDGNIDDADSTVDLTTGSTFYADADEDTFGDAENAVDACAAPEGHVEDSTDCDDEDAAVNPDGTEVCDEIDNDCDDLTDDEDDTLDLSTATESFEDLDGDGYGDINVSQTTCTVPDTHVLNSDDCDDVDELVNPDALEVCDGVDNDCNGDVDDDDDGLDISTQTTYWEDWDEDGAGDPAVSMDACSAPEGYVDNDWDCDDLDAALNAADADADLITTCDGDCDDADDTVGVIDEDGDGYSACLDDCDDTSAWLNNDDNDADGQSTCDGDCKDDDAMIYTGAATAEPSYCTQDLDADGYGDAHLAINCYNFAMADSYGDGWNGNAFDISIDGELYSSVTLEGSTYEDDCTDGIDNDGDGVIDCGSAGSTEVCIPGGELVISYTSGSWAAEISVVVTTGGAPLFELPTGAASAFADGEVLFTATVPTTGTDCDDDDAGVAEIDLDGDGFSACVDDCNDDDALITPSDLDGDGYYGCGPVTDCDDDDATSTGTDIDADCDGVLTADDCDDEDVDFGAIAEDADCDGDDLNIDCDESDPDVHSLDMEGGICGEDSDGDGYGAETPDNANATAGTDCEDNWNIVYPGAAFNEPDVDGDGLVDCTKDFDGDGYALTNIPTDATYLAGTDCDDNTDTTYLGAAELEDPTACMADADEDGIGDAYPSCLSFYCNSDEDVTAGTDCDDSEATIGQTDDDGDGVYTCGTSEDCDDADANVGGSYPALMDTDGDGFGEDGTEAMICSLDSDGDGVDDYSVTGGDCDDTDATTYPGAAFNDSTTECMTDADGDGYGAGEGCYQLVLQDTWGDGWTHWTGDYAYVDFYVDGVLHASETLGTNLSLGGAVVCVPGGTLQIGWTEPGGYNSECSFQLFDMNLNQLYDSGYGPVNTDPSAGDTPLYEEAVQITSGGSDSDDSDSSVW